MATTYRAKMKTGDFVEGTLAEYTVIAQTLRRVHGDVKSDIFRTFGGKLVNLSEVQWFEQNSDDVSESTSRIAVMTRELALLNRQGRTEEASKKATEIAIEVASVDTSATAGSIYESIDMDGDPVTTETIFP